MTLALKRPAVRLLPALLLAPLLLWVAVFYVAPLSLMVWRSFQENGFSLAPYTTLLQSKLYWDVISTTFLIALITTVGCLLFGYPVAYLVASMTSTKLRAFVLVLVFIPYWLDYIVRTYAWMVLLGRRGAVNTMLQWLGITDAPVTLLYNLFSVCLGMIQVLLPLMILTLFGNMVRIDRGLLQAAHIHGATPWRAFWNVYFPLSLPGVYGASLLVFVLSLGFYITPTLLGGPKQSMISQFVFQMASDRLDWAGASAAGTILLVVTMAIVLVYNRFFSLDRLWGGHDK